VPKLVVFRGDAVENEIRLAGTTLRVGRNDRNDVVLDDGANGVSRFHAEIRAEGDAYVIVDLNSRNGVWINGRRIKEQAPLMLGVPVTIGGFELAVEDDASSADFDLGLVPRNPSTVIAGSPEDRPPDIRAAHSESTRSPVSTQRRQALLWTGAAAVTVLICVITFFVVRYQTRPARAVATNDSLPVIPATTTTVPLAPPENPTKETVAKYLADARIQMQAGDYAGALSDQLRPALELDPENTEALELKRQAEEVIAAPRPKPPKPPVPKPEETKPEAEAPGIPVRPNELAADYAARVRRVQTGLSEGKKSLDKQDFSAALTHFRAVERDQPDYQGVEALITEATTKQQKAFEEAMNGGQQNEQAGKLRDALLWYQRALEVEPSSTTARERAALLRTRLAAQANDLLTKANLAAKMQDSERAIRLYQQVIDLMPPGDDIREKAVQQLEALKRR
jgi:pSer/pThr/pTyr-binding forkhead associated (FHA) protein/tetratricopeptide (TPR) repeat protein